MRGIIRNLQPVLTRRSAGTPSLRLTAAQVYRPIWPAPRHSSNLHEPEKQSRLLPLADVLATAIKANGPITIAQFMRQCLTSPHGGYYSSSPDPFGKGGDFITSPEISQLFGEMLGIWLVAEDIAQKLASQAKNIQLIELGPGRGTLMDDLLRTVRSFKNTNEHIDAVYLIETSEGLRKRQHKKLCGENTLVQVDKAQWRSVLKDTDVPVTWYEHVKMLPTCSAPFFVAHEFFDALPIHSFTKTVNGWREILVDYSVKNTNGIIKSTSPQESFNLTLSKTPTAHSVLLPSLSQRYEALSTANTGNVEVTIEVSPESHLIVEEIAKRIGNARAGGALIFDYGPADTIPANTLRGIRSHRRVSPLEAPGEVDISADVDFLGLVHTALQASEGVEVHGPVEQGHFLHALGMQHRLERLQAGKCEQKAKELRGGYERLVDRGPMGMGRIYKALAICPEAGNRPPVGFGGAL